MTLRPFFSYYGGKWRSAVHYPPPKHSMIIEPFAGAAGYSTRYADREVVLVEKAPAIAALWRYLIRTPAEEIRRLPLIEPGQAIADLKVCAEAAVLIGMALNPGGAAPKASRGKAWTGANYETTNKMNSWTAAFRERVASQVDSIRHWKVLEGCYSRLPDHKATWFIDPPYRCAAGQLYLEKASAIDFAQLAKFCRTRTGQTIVCEAQGADWLPFQALGAKVKCTPTKRQGRKYSAEAVWIQEAE